MQAPSLGVPSVASATRSEPLRARDAHCGTRRQHVARKFVTHRFSGILFFAQRMPTKRGIDALSLRKTKGLQIFRHHCIQAHVYKYNWMDPPPVV
jgi:hypothetical protein